MDYSLGSSSDESDCNKLSPDLPSFDIEEVTRDDRKEEGVYKDLKDYGRGYY